MLHACLQILHVLGGKSFLIQLLHCPSKVTQESTTLSRDVVNAGFSSAADVGIWLEKSLRLTWRHHYVYEAIAQQAGTSDGEFARFRNFDVIINLQRYVDPLPFADHSRTTRDFSDFGTCEQYIGTF